MAGIKNTRTDRPGRVSNRATYREKALLHSDVVDDHWLWHGATQNGVPRVGRHPGDTSSRAPINLRVALLREKRRGRMPKTAHSARATCGVASCVNPDHLAWESRREMYDRIGAAAGEKLSKIDPERYAEAIEWHRSGELSARECAMRLGVSPTTLYKHWRALGYSRG